MYNTTISPQEDQTDVESGWDNDIDISNLVEGKPIYYLANESDVVLDSNSNAGVVYCIDCKNITLNGLNLVKNMYGVYFFNTIDSKVENCHINNNELAGIIFSYSMNNSIYRNNVGHNQNGIGMLDSNNNSIVSNGIRYNNMSGVTFVFGSYLNTIIDNQIERNDGGVVFYRSSYNAIIGNNVSDNNRSIVISDSINNTIEGNNATYSELGIALSTSRNSSINGNNASYNEMGIVLQASNDNVINGNNASYNENSGIELVDSNNNDITGNRVDYNEMGGFVLSESSNNTIRANNASYNEYGIGTERSCNNNTLFMNSFCHNTFGIGLLDSNNNSIYRNSLVDNEVVSAIDNGTNTWDNGSAGNYYSDFNCTDSDGDGICDSVCRIFGGESVDRYPLASPPT
ncbi:MAG TPA: NosD domain-containing protein [Methanothrix sp.]|nr:NosD domain-containing protein [Methanothrix sp.]